MNREFFLDELKWQKKDTKRRNKMPAGQFFEREEGQLVIKEIAKNVIKIADDTFIMQITSSINYPTGRNFFEDMEQLGFNWEHCTRDSDDYYVFKFKNE